MNRRQLFLAGTPLVLAAGPLQAAAPTGSPNDVGPNGAKTPLFPEDAQFWFETVRMFGADEYGGASFGEGPYYIRPDQGRRLRQLVRRLERNC